MVLPRDHQKPFRKQTFFTPPSLVTPRYKENKSRSLPAILGNFTIGSFLRFIKANNREMNRCFDERFEALHSMQRNSQSLL
jgi:hypothetical protein